MQCIGIMPDSKDSITYGKDISVINNAISFNRISIKNNDHFDDEYILFIGGNSKRKNLSKQTVSI